MRVRALLVSILLLTAAMACLAAGYGNITGTTPDGWRLAMFADAKPVTVNVWKEGLDHQILSAQRFENEPCEFVDDDTSRRLTCAATGKSPLAGTKYVGRPFNGDCEKGDPEYMFDCTEGCEKNPRAPRNLTQGHWEC